METNATKISMGAACWSCGAAPGGAHFCKVCGKIQPLGRDANYFQFFGLPQRLTIDPAELEQRFHQLSWKLHPDNFVRTSEYERQLSLERSSQLNDAFRTLRDRISRVEYLLGRAGMRREGQQKQQAPPELLEEVFELNESMDELREARQAAPDSAQMAALRRKLQAARANFDEKLSEIDIELEKMFGEWDRAAGDDAGSADYTAAQKKMMERMNEVLNRRSYVRNLVQTVQKELAEV